MPMDLVSQMTLLGGVCARRTLLELRPRAEIDAALRDGRLVRDARGRYALPLSPPALRIAGSINGVLSHRSAAAYWGWAQKGATGLPEVTVPRTRSVDRGLRKILIPHWSDLPDTDVVRGVTSLERTLVDCMRNLPWDEALVIVDSAVRADDIDKASLLALARSTRGRGRRRIICVAEAATGAAHNVFETALRAHAHLIPGLSVVAQMAVPLEGRTLHPDLVDPALGIILEAEGFEWHGKPAQLSRDCRRYNAFTLRDWSVYRFTWRQVMHEPAYVQWVLLNAVDLAHRHANVAGGGPARST